MDILQFTADGWGTPSHTDSFETQLAGVIAPRIGDDARAFLSTDRRGGVC